MEYGPNATANATSQINNGARPKETSGDTLTGQLGHLDELINMARSAFERTQKIADVLAPAPPTPMNPEKTSETLRGSGQLDPNSGPILYRLQNRNQELHRLLDDIAMQQCRIEGML